MRRDTIRQILLDTSRLSYLYPGQLDRHPAQRWWKFDRRRDTRAARQLAVRLRVLASRLERWLDGDART